jgi:hypothetical protein
MSVSFIEHAHQSEREIGQRNGDEPEMYSLQSDGTIPHPLEPGMLGRRRRRALPSPCAKLALETCPAALQL